MLPLAGDVPGVSAPTQSRQADIVAHAELEGEPVSVAPFGDEDDAGAEAAGDAGPPEVDRARRRMKRSRGGRDCSSEQVRDILIAVARQPGDPENLAAGEGEGDVAD